MELFLNLLWAAIATAILCVWRFAWTRERSRNWAPAAQWTSIGLALVLMFFVVSLTDDLNATLMLFDECGSARRHSSVCARHHAPANEARAPQGASGFGASTERDEACFERRLELAVDVARPRASQASTSQGRAPPEIPS